MGFVAIIDYGMGNLHSVAKAVEYVAPDAHIQVTADVEVIRSSDRVILPGVGAMRDCMAEILRLGIGQIVAEVSADRPFLGICVGMQALMRNSEENDGVDCLDLFPEKVQFFGESLSEKSEEGTKIKLKVPHMGWNKVKQRPHPLWHNIDDLSRFYFVHSYYVESHGQEFVAGETEYGKCIAAAVARDHIFATQFHPEKSQHDGLQLLKNFMNWNGRY